MPDLIKWLTGARKGEQGRVLLAFLAVLSLLISYYLVKPYRNSKFLSEFDPSMLPFVYMAVAFLSFCVTKIFSHLTRKIEKYRLVASAYITIAICKLWLGHWLTGGGRVAVICFYFFASVYFLLAIATLWACINDLFTPEQSERCFGFVALGGTLGGILGSLLSGELAKSRYSDYPLFISVGFLLAALGFVLLAARLPGERPPRDEKHSLKGSKSGFWSELVALQSRPYIRHIALSVLLLAVSTTAVDLVSQATIDKQLARQEFESRLSDIPGLEFEQAYALKAETEQVRARTFAALSHSSDLSAHEISERFEGFRNELEKKTRGFFSNVYKFQGLAGILSLLVVARVLFPRVGMRFCYSMLPIFSLAGLALFSLTVNLQLVLVVLVINGALNYSLNNAAKEILYTATDEETLFRFKPMIEGPCMRAGDVLSSLLNLSTRLIAVTLALPQIAVFVVFTTTLLTYWVRVTWLAGKEYDLERKPEGVI